MKKSYLMNLVPLPTFMYQPRVKAFQEHGQVASHLWAPIRYPSNRLHYIAMK